MTYTRYRHLAIERAKAPPTPAQLAAIEAVLGATLPDSFKRYLEVANGGYLEYEIDVPTGDGRIETMSFCSLFRADEGESLDETFIGEIRAAREYANIPTGVLPFARDGGDSMVFLDLSPQGGGRVIAFVQGLPEWTGKRTESSYVTVASSFDAYVDALRIDSERARDHLANGVENASHIAAMEAWLDIGLPEWRSDAGFIAALSAATRRVRGG